MATDASSTSGADFHEEDALGKAYDGRLVRRLLTYVRPYVWLVATAVLLLFGEGALQLVGPVLTKRVIDVALPARNYVMVWHAALIFMAALVTQFGCSYGETLLTSLLGQRVMRDLRLQLFTHLQALPVAFFDRNPVGRLVTRVTSDVEALNELFTAGVVAGLGDLFTLLAIAIMMLVTDWRLALAAFLVIPLVYVTSHIFRIQVRRSYREIRTRLARINAFLQERLTGIRIVQLFGRERREARRFDTLNRGYLEANLRSITVYALYLPAIEVLTSVALASLLIAGARRVELSTLTVGTVVAFLQLVRRFFQPLQDLSDKYNTLQQAMASSERIFKLLDEPESATTALLSPLLPSLPSGKEGGNSLLFQASLEMTRGLRPPDPQLQRDGIPVASAHPPRGDMKRGSPSPLAGRGLRGGEPEAHTGLGGGGGGGATGHSEVVTIEFEDVWFAYDLAHMAKGGADTIEPEWVLKGVSFRVEPGETVAIVGHTGAGKTTIVSLLMRFYDPQRGRITLNGVDIRHLPVAELREKIGYVQQDIFLFAGDIATNIRLSAPLTDDQVATAAARVGADRVIRGLPEGYHYQLGERGASISVGERQLLSFARAIAADPALLLLDEATSAVDSEIEAEIQEALATLMRGRTTIAIAHRLSTILPADEILVMQHGEIRERGTHRELLARGELYDRLYRLQIGESTAPSPATAAVSV